jgi:hypothetical protein
MVQKWLASTERMGAASRRDMKTVIESVWKKRTEIAEELGFDVDEGYIELDWRTVMREQNLDLLLVYGDSNKCRIDKGKCADSNPDCLLLSWVRTILSRAEGGTSMKSLALRGCILLDEPGNHFGGIHLFFQRLSTNKLATIRSSKTSPTLVIHGACG